VAAERKKAPVQYERLLVNPDGEIVGDGGIRAITDSDIRLLRPSGGAAFRVTESKDKGIVTIASATAAGYALYARLIRFSAGVDRAAKWGSLTPQCRSARLPNGVVCDTGGKERRRQ
jgi:hypothetical protein